MLTSLRKPCTKSLLPAIHSQMACSSNSDNNRAKILRIRNEQKQLFGSVIRDNSSGKRMPAKAKQIDADQCHTNVIEIDRANNFDVKLQRPGMASEFHWMVRTQGASKSIKIFKSSTSRTKIVDMPATKNSSSPKSKSANSSNRDTSQGQTANIDGNSRRPNSVISPKSAIISAKNLIQQFVSSHRSNGKHKQSQIIPFDDGALKSIVNYPLICEKGLPSKTDEIIADKSIRLPSISKVLQATMPESARIALKKWKADKIAELGFDGFLRYQQDTFKRGTDFHLAIEQFLNSGEVPEPDSSVIKLWDSIDNSMKTLKPKSVLSEQPILHADLKYHGIIDNVSIVKDELSAFEWKTSEKTKPRLTSTYDAPVQLCAYLGALNADPRYDLTVKSGYVVVAYTNGTKANVFNLSEADLRKYWLIWLQRLQEYWIRVRDDTLPDPI